jgi:hypothetical protein
MEKGDEYQTLTSCATEKGDQPQTITSCAMEKCDQPQPHREQASEVSDDEDKIVIYCAFSDPESDSDKPRPKFDFTKPVQFVGPVTPSGPEAEYKKVEAARERESARAERCRKRLASAANGDVSVKQPKITLRRANVGAPPHKGGQVPRRFFL